MWSNLQNQILHCHVTLLAQSDLSVLTLLLLHIIIGESSEDLLSFIFFSKLLHP
jgi:hypothetical protein